MKNILAPIDFSDVSEKVIFQAAELAKEFSCKLWLLHVAAPEPDFVGYSVGPQEERDWRALTLQNEHRYIQEKALFLEKEGIKVTPLLVEGETISIILGKIDKFDIDMVVMGTHGHGKLYSLIVGSVSQGVLQKTTVPVLLVPARK
ncbi:MAG: universal stress protein [Candidatus Delongbacteria bacterium]|jgi:nucleotide-binding universal stress UspA family protein|nr:universal stress protein [Candidatus Delongbacteria bacterium]